MRILAANVRNRFLLFLSTKKISFSVMILILLILTIDLIYYQVNSMETKSRQIEALRINQEKNSNLLFMMEENIHAVYVQLATDTRINDWISSDSVDYYSLYDIQKTFVSIINSIPEISSIYIYNRKNDQIISSNYAISALSQFPDNMVFQESNQQTPNRIWLESRQVGNSSSPVISFISSVPLFSQNGVIVINVSLNSMLSQLADNQGGLILLDRNNHLLAFQDSKLYLLFRKNESKILTNAVSEINQTSAEYTAFYKKDRLDQWKFVSILPYIQTKNNNLPQILIVFILSVIEIAAFLFLKNPLTKRVGTLQTEENTLDDLQRRFVINLLAGEVHGNEAVVKAKEFGIDPLCEFFVIIFQIEGYLNYLLNISDDERLFLNRIIFRAIKSMFGMELKTFVVKTELEKISILVPVHSSEVIKEIVNQTVQIVGYIQKEIRDFCQLTLFIAVSDVSRGIENVPACYVNALNALKYKSFYQNRTLIFYEEIRHKIPSNSSTRPSYKIPEFLQEGELEKIKMELNHFFGEMASPNEFHHIDELNIACANLVYEIIKATLDLGYKIRDIFGDQDLFLGIYSSSTVEDKHNYLLRICMKILEFKRNKENNQNNETVQYVLDYIHKYFDQDISLTKVGDDLHMNPSYISALIKNHLGIGFVNYVNELRIKKSISLLLNTNYTIKEISDACGYETVHSYIRNFKKYNLMSPNEFRKSQRSLKGQNVTSETLDCQQ